MLKAGFFRDVCCRREASLGEENIFGIWIIWDKNRPWGRWWEVELLSLGTAKERTDKI